MIGRDFLAPVGLAYSSVAEIRKLFYDQEFLKGERLNKPVVSVGNLTVGGTGKTPLVDYLLSQFESENLKACVLTRGYGRLNTQTTSKVLNAKSSPLDCGDEPVWLARRHPKSVVVVGADRVESANLIQDADIYVLDDGLQHLRVKRDLDIVLLDATSPNWHYRPLPWGYGREKFSGVKRSDIVVLTRVNQVESKQLQELKNLVRSHGVTKIIESQILVRGCQEVWSQKNIELKGKNIFLVSGIANPGSFEKSVRASGANIVGHDIRPDHYVYSQESLDEIVLSAKKLEAQIILTTEKDAVKWQLLRDSQSEILIGQLSVEMEFQPQLTGIYGLAVDRFH